MHDHRRWRRLLLEQSRSGLRVFGLWPSRGLAPSSLRRWRRELADDGSPRRGGAARTAVVELGALPSISGISVVIVFGSGRRVEIASGAEAAWVAQLIGRLERTRERSTA